MNTHEAGTVSVGVIGVILAISGVTTSLLGVSWFFAIRRAAERDAKLLGGSADIALVPLVVIFATAAVLVATGVAVSLLRERIARIWIAPRNGASAGGSSSTSPARGTIAVGVVGLCFTIMGAIGVGTTALSGFVNGWDDGGDLGLWTEVGYLVIGALLTMRPRWISALWDPRSSETPPAN